MGPQSNLTGVLIRSRNLDTRKTLKIRVHTEEDHGRAKKRAEC